MQQGTKSLLGTPASQFWSICFQSWFLCFPSTFSLMCLGRQHRLVQIFEALPPSWEAWVELQAPGLYLAPPRLLWAFEEETSRWERPLPLSLALPFSYSLFFSHFAFQIHCPRFFKSQKKKSYSDFHLTDKDRDQQTTIHNPNPAFHLLV